MALQSDGKARADAAGVLCPSTPDQAIEYARSRGLERLEAQQLMLHVLGRDASQRAWLIAHGDQPLDTATSLAWQQALQRLLRGEPLAYIVGWQSFYGLRLKIDARVLVPRPDTETLVDWAVEVLDDLGRADPSTPQVLDLGTGSGAVALAIRHQRPAVTVTATDVSEPSLAVARDNAQRLGLELRLQQASWWQGVAGAFNVVVSNPPYIRPGDPHLEALCSEPRHALVAQDDGLADLYAIVDGAMPHLLPGGWLLLEHGYDQAEAVCARLRAAGFDRVQDRKDLAGVTRCSGGQRPQAAPVK